MENRKPYSKTKETISTETQEARTRLKKEINRAVKKVTRRKSNRNKIIIILTLAGLYAVFSLVISLNEAIWKNEAIPEWHELYEAAGFVSSAPKGIDGEAAVHFIDVGQGDCALITAGDYTVLIDSGEISEKSNVITYIHSLNIEHLDMVIASHAHSDHIGALGAIIDEFGTDKLVMAEVTEEMTPITTSFENLMISAEECGAEIIYAEKGDIYTISDGCTIDILAPVKDYEDHNNYSVVCRFNYGQSSFLFTGDIEQLAERDIVDSETDISADIIKIAHHGSNTSSLKVFLQNVDPKYAVISVGSENDYGHPNTQTLELLRLLEIDVYRTDYHGNIAMYTDGKEIKVATEKESIVNVYY